MTMNKNISVPIHGRFMIISVEKLNAIRRQIVNVFSVSLAKGANK
jgi:hypothetical protein